MTDAQDATRHPHRRWPRILGWTLLGIFAIFATGVSVMPRPSAMVLAGDHEVLIRAGEIVHETFGLTGRTVRIDGKVDGDAFASGDRVIVNGEIDGNLEVAAGTLEITEGAVVNGTVHCLCGKLALDGHVRDNLYMLGESLLVAHGGRVGRDAIVIGSKARIEGGIARDLRSWAGHVELAGIVGRDVHGTVGHLTVEPAAAVGRDVVVAAPSNDVVTVETGAAIAGRMEVEEHPELGRARSPSRRSMRCAGVRPRHDANARTLCVRSRRACAV